MDAEDKDEFKDFFSSSDFLLLTTKYSQIISTYPFLYPVFFQS